MDAMIARAAVLFLLVAQSCATHPAVPDPAVARDREKAFLEEIERESPQCEFEAVHAHEDPRVLLDELLRRAAHGDFLRTEPWLFSVAQCPGYLPAPDTYTIIESYRVVSFTAKETSAVASVEYRFFGQTGGFGPDGMAKLIEDRRTGTVQIEMNKTPFGWRLPNVSVGAVWQNVLREHTRF